MLTFGELPAWITVGNLLMKYVLGTAAVGDSAIAKLHAACCTCVQCFWLCSAMAMFVTVTSPAGRQGIQFIHRAAVQRRAGHTAGWEHQH